MIQSRVEWDILLGNKCIAALYSIAALKQIAF